MEATIPGGDLLRLLGDDEVVVVDCRSVAERQDDPVQIPGSLRMSLEELTDSPCVLPDDELIVLVDETGGARAHRAWRALLIAGRTAVCLRGGLAAWANAGCPTERIELPDRSAEDVCQSHG